MESPTGIIPEALMYYSKRTEAYNYLLSLPIHGDVKRDLWVGWCSWVGLYATAREKQVLFDSGI